MGENHVTEGGAGGDVPRLQIHTLFRPRVRSLLQPPFPPPFPPPPFPPPPSFLPSLSFLLPFSLFSSSSALFPFRFRPFSPFAFGLVAMEEAGGVRVRVRQRRKGGEGREGESAGGRERAREGRCAGGRAA